MHLGVWRALEKLELLSATLPATFTLLSCSSNSRVQPQLNRRTLTMHELLSTFFFCLGNAIRVIVPVASVLGLLVLLLTWRYARNRNRDNNNDPGNDEGRPLLDNGAGDPHADVIHNQIEEWNPANRPRPMPIGASHTNADVNVITSSHAWGSVTNLGLILYSCFDINAQLWGPHYHFSSLQKGAPLTIICSAQNTQNTETNGPIVSNFRKLS